MVSIRRFWRTEAKGRVGTGAERSGMSRLDTSSPEPWFSSRSHAGQAAGTVRGHSNSIVGYNGPCFAMTLVEYRLTL